MHGFANEDWASLFSPNAAKHPTPDISRVQGEFFKQKKKKKPKNCPVSVPEPGLHAEQTAVEMRRKILFFRSSKKKNTLKDKMMGDEVRREEKKKKT